MNKKLRFRNRTSEATVKDFLTVRQEGSRQVNRSQEYYKSDFDKHLELFEGRNEEGK